MVESAVCFDVRKCMQYCSFLLLRRKLKMFASELLLQVVEESKLPECSSSHLHHWSPVPKSASQTGCFHLVVKNSNYPWFAQVNIPLQEQQKMGSSTIWKICTHTTTQQPHSTSRHTQKPERKNKKASANFTNCSFWWQWRLGSKKSSDPVHVAQLWSTTIISV